MPMSRPTAHADDAQIDVMAKQLNVKREEVIEMETRMSGGDVVLDPALATTARGLRPHRLPGRRRA
jgi:DNA-directed RNA polymerase sigma subunit (sigma70/sigma32)